MTTTWRSCLAALAMAAGIVVAATPASADGPATRYDRHPSAIWQGLYAGIHLGYGWADPAEGFVGGAQIGYNWQAGQIVYGLEADVSYADMSGELFGFIDVSVDWMATVRGRLGFLLTPNLLAYGTAGYGWVGASASIPGFSISETESDFVFGAGVEAKLSPTSSLRVEYLSFGDLEVDVVRAGLSFKLGN